jgi:hypothetical protein
VRTVNGAEAGSFAAAERWTRSTLRFPRRALLPGLNRLTLAWPSPPAVEGDPLAADLHPVFGEVFLLRVLATCTIQNIR